jgi:hypothetical protein
MIGPMRMRSLLLVTGAALCLAWAGVAAASAPKRLNKPQWGTYQKAAAAFTAQTTKTVTRFRFCRNSTKYNRDLGLFGQCLGTSATREVAAINALSAVLNRFAQKTSGACANSLTAYLKTLFFLKSTVIGVERAVQIKAADAATVAGQAANAAISAQKVSAAGKAFAGACKPLTS